MLDKSGIIRRMALADANAQKELNQWEGPDHPDPSLFAESIYRYVLYKFLLDDEDLPETHELNALAALSVEKAGRLNPNEAALLDVSKHCGATSSFMVKYLHRYWVILTTFLTMQQPSHQWQTPAIYISYASN